MYLKVEAQLKLLLSETLLWDIGSLSYLQLKCNSNLLTPIAYIANANFQWYIAWQTPHAQACFEIGVFETANLAAPGSNLLELGVFAIMNGVPLHTAFH